MVKYFSRIRGRIDSDIAQIRALLTDEQNKIDIKDLFAIGYQYSIVAFTTRQYLNDCLTVAIGIKAYPKNIIKSMRSLQYYVARIENDEFDRHFEDITDQCASLINKKYDILFENPTPQPGTTLDMAFGLVEVARQLAERSSAI